MTNYYARARKTRGSYFDTLVADQAKTSGANLEDLRATVADVPLTADVRLVVADQPAPARGYAIIHRVGDGIISAALHVLDGQPVEVYRALFSQTSVQAKQLAGDAEFQILVDRQITATNVLDAIRAEGAPYGLAVFEGTDSAPDGLTNEERAAYDAAGIRTVTIVYGDEANEPKQLLAETGALVERPSDPARTPDWEFMGWLSAPTEKRNDAAAWHPHDFDAPITEDITITAMWGDEESGNWEAVIVEGNGTDARITLQGEHDGVEPIAEPDWIIHEGEGYIRADSARYTQLDDPGVSALFLEEGRLTGEKHDVKVADDTPVGATSDHPDGTDPDEPGEDDQSDTPSEPLPGRTASTATWVAYAENHPTDPPLDLTPRKGLRDLIAAHYIDG